MFIGSEGALGVITEAWLRVFPRPTRRCSATVRFASMNAGLTALRSIVQAGIAPTNARLLDNLEALLSGAGAGDSCLLLLAFESAGVDFAPLLEAACEIARSHGGLIPAEQVRVQAGGRDDTADSYKSAFFRAPYLRDELALMDVHRALTLDLGSDTSLVRLAAVSALRLTDTKITAAPKDEKLAKQAKSLALVCRDLGGKGALPKDFEKYLK
jgi:hypothetical protein